MSAPDFRGFLGALDEAGELLRVDEEVDCELEVGARTRGEAAGRNRAVLFERIHGYPGARILSNAMGSPSRIGIALGLPAGRSFRRIRQVARARLESPIPSTLVSERRNERKTWAGDEVDLTMLPVPRWAPEDAGRYVGTWHLNLTRDPLTRVRNIGVYRMQLLGPRTALVSASRASHLMAHVLEAEERGESLEMAVAIGVPEPLVLAAGMAVSAETDEFSLAGALADAPVRVRAAESVDLEVPDDAEIVIEGRITSGERVAEGPFVDYAGVARPNPTALVFQASRVSVRKDAIFRGAAVGFPGAEDHLVYALLASAGRLDFRSNRARHHLQRVCLKVGWYGSFQALGRMERPFQILARGQRAARRVSRATTRPFARR
jgi:4-hydroxy-3-polyprenylbenzoate decarboxylase